MGSGTIILNVLTSKVFRKIKEAAGPYLTEEERNARIARGETMSEVRHIVLSGSSRSTKTYSALQFIISCCLANPGLQCAIIRAKLTWLRKTVFKDFVKIMHMAGLWDPSRMNRSEWEYTFDNGSQISFIGMDQDAGFAKVHGMKTDLAFYNEITELSYDHVRQVDIRNTWLQIYDFNPNCPERYWIYERILSQTGKAVHIHSTYKDNPFLERRVVESIEAYEPTPANIARGTADKTFWDIYGLGVRGTISGLVFTNWRMVKDLPDKLDKPGYGMDFGFTNDPTTLTFCGQTPGEIWVDELIYERDLVNLCVPNNPGIRSIEGEMLRLKVKKTLPMYCESAEPKTVRDMQNAGFNAIPVVKGPGSVVAGITGMKRFRLNVTERSIHIIAELGNYKWKDQKGSLGEAFVNEPVDAWNHCLDGIRYYVMSCEPGSCMVEQGRTEMLPIRVGRGVASRKYDMYQGPDNEEGQEAHRRWLDAVSQRSQ